MEVFLIVSLIRLFQVKALEILRPNSSTLSITSKASPLMRIGSNSYWKFVKDIQPRPQGFALKKEISCRTHLLREKPWGRG